MQGSEQIQINASPERVYALVADLTRMGEWSPECQRVEWDERATGPAEGATFTGYNPGRPAPAAPVVPPGQSHSCRPRP
jgi:hypothetical protein